MMNHHSVPNRHQLRRFVYSAVGHAGDVRLERTISLSLFISNTVLFVGISIMCARACVAYVDLYLCVLLHARWG